MLPVVPDLIVAATLTCAGALMLGQGACRLCGMRTWTFLSAPVGLALLMLLSMAAIHAPGHATTIAVLLLTLVLIVAVILIREPGQRPAVTDLLTAVPIAFLVLLPFLASSRAGTLGVSFDNDMQVHLLWAEAIRLPSIAKITSLDAAYPLGPHALCAVLARATGMRVDYAFAGEMMALPILLGWTALGALRRVGWPGKTFAVTLTSVTFLIVAYYAEASFKEIMQALFVLGFALGIDELIPGERRALFRWVPLALIVGGSLSVYSVAGLPWIVAMLGLWLIVIAARQTWRGYGIRRLMVGIRAALAPCSLALGVLLILIVPQLPRLINYYQSATKRGDLGIAVSELGNLAGPISFWKVFGIWDNPDFRMPPIEPFHAGIFVGFAVVVAVVGGIWWLRRGDFIVVPLAAGVALAIWLYSNADQSPYVAAKALVILAPLVMLIATRWLVEIKLGDSWLSSFGLLRIGVIALLGWGVLDTSAQALRHADVGPTTRVDELRNMEPTLGTSPTLFLGWDNFIKWELAGTPVDQPYAESPVLALNPRKAWAPGQTLDFDDIPAGTLDRYRYVVGPRDPAGSQPPSNMILIRTTRYYEVWERRGPTPERQTLAEGSEPGATLDCATSSGRALARSTGEAAVREPNVVVPLPGPVPGETVQIQMRLKPGRWWLSTPYTSLHPVEITAPDLHTILPANLDRPGARWLIGSITVTGNAPVTVSFHVENTLFAPAVPTPLNALVATSEKPISVVPLRQACGKYIDWYRTDSKR
jgi:hypothetical protein